MPFFHEVFDSLFVWLISYGGHYTHFIITFFRCKISERNITINLVLRSFCINIHIYYSRICEYKIEINILKLGSVYQQSVPFFIWKCLCNKPLQMNSHHTHTDQIRYEYSSKRNITYVNARNVFHFYMVHKISIHTH